MTKVLIGFRIIYNYKYVGIFVEKENLYGIKI